MDKIVKKVCTVYTYHISHEACKICKVLSPFLCIVISLHGTMNDKNVFSNSVSTTTGATKACTMDHVAKIKVFT